MTAQINQRLLQRILHDLRTENRFEQASDALSSLSELGFYSVELLPQLENFVVQIGSLALSCGPQRLQVVEVVQDGLRTVADALERGRFSLLERRPQSKHKIYHQCLLAVFTQQDRVKKAHQALFHQTVRLEIARRQASARPTTNRLVEPTPAATLSVKPDLDVKPTPGASTNWDNGNPYLTSFEGGTARPLASCSSVESWSDVKISTQELEVDELQDMSSPSDDAQTGVRLDLDAQPKAISNSDDTKPCPTSCERSTTCPPASESVAYSHPDVKVSLREREEDELRDILRPTSPCPPVPRLRRPRTVVEEAQPESGVIKSEQGSPQACCELKGDCHTCFLSSQYVERKPFDDAHLLPLLTPTPTVKLECED